jgi:transcriptional regulator with XRE-family HTH domain
MTLGERFRQAREGAGLSQGQVAEYVGTGQGYISDIELGKRWPSTWTLLEKLARHYRVDPAWLLGMGDEEPAELPSYGQELLDIVAQLSEGRRRELVTHAQVMLDAEQAESDMQQLRAMLDVVEAVGGGEALDAILDILEVAQTDRGAALARMDAFFAGRVGRPVITRRRSAVAGRHEQAQKKVEQ